MMASRVITNTRRLRKFLAIGGKIEDTVIWAGQVSGRAMYPRGHVGRKSRDKSSKRHRIKAPELARRAEIHGYKQDLAKLEKEFGRASRKQAIGALKRYFKARGHGADYSRTLAGKKSRRTPVARVAGVLSARDGYHSRGVRNFEHNAVPFRVNIIREAHGGKDVSRLMKAMGRGARDSIRKELVAERHVDTGKLKRNTQYQIENLKGSKKSRAETRAQTRRVSQKRRQNRQRARQRAMRQRRRG